MRHKGLARLGACLLGIGATLWLAGGPAFADSVNGGGTTADKLTHGEIGLNLLWIVIGAVLVIFMQAGSCRRALLWSRPDSAARGMPPTW